jgi:hypothetical protein
MTTILRSIYCIPCLWSLIGGLGTFGIISFILNAWVPFRGPLPADGPVEGFASKAARIEFYDTGPLRIRTATKVGAICAVVWTVGLIASYLVLSYLGGAA